MGGVETSWFQIPEFCRMGTLPPAEFGLLSHIQCIFTSILFYLFLWVIVILIVCLYNFYELIFCFNVIVTQLGYPFGNERQKFELLDRINVITVALFLILSPSPWHKTYYRKFFFLNQTIFETNIPNPKSHKNLAKSYANVETGNHNKVQGELELWQQKLGQLTTRWRQWN